MQIPQRVLADDSTPTCTETLASALTAEIRS